MLYLYHVCNLLQYYITMFHFNPPQLQHNISMYSFHIYLISTSNVAYLTSNQRSSSITNGHSEMKTYTFLRLYYLQFLPMEWLNKPILIYICFHIKRSQPHFRQKLQLHHQRTWWDEDHTLLILLDRDIIPRYINFHVYLIPTTNAANNFTSNQGSNSIANGRGENMIIQFAFLVLFAICFNTIAI